MIITQEFIPTRDNVVFLIDAQHSMFESAGLKDTEVSAGATLSSMPVSLRLVFHVMCNSQFWSWGYVPAGVRGDGHMV